MLTPIQQEEAQQAAEWMEQRCVDDLIIRHPGVPEEVALRIIAEVAAAPTYQAQTKVHTDGSKEQGCLRECATYEYPLPQAWNECSQVN